MDLTSMIFPNVDREHLAHALDGVGHETRLRTVREWGKRELSQLFEQMADAEPLTLDYFVPAGTEPMKEVIHWGKNSLGAFTHFQKRFCRPDDDAAASEQLWGYNHQTMQPFTGPGYFVTHAWKEGGIVIDYTMLPPRHPEGWPTILPNTARLSRFVYNGMQDVMRRVSEHVSVGRARRGDQIMDAWFALVREDLELK